MTRASVKVPRRADTEERARAKDIVDLYRAAQSAPDGCVCLNPDAAPEAQQFHYADDIEFLLSRLEDFAETGTFAPNDGWVKDFVVRTDVNARIKAGANKTTAVRDAALKFNVSERSVWRLIE